MRRFEPISVNFFQCISTGEVFAVKMRWDGTILGAAGPLSADALRSPDDYQYGNDLTGFLQNRSDKLILMDPVGV